MTEFQFSYTRPNNSIRVYLLSLVVCGTSWSSCSQAGQISLAEFSPAAVVQDFESVGTGVDLMTPLLIDDDTFRANDNVLARSSKLGPVIGRSGVAIANRRSQTVGSDSFIEIDLGVPAIRAGLFVGFEFSWSVEVEFFDAEDELVGSIPLNGLGPDSAFAGWQRESGRIARIRVNDLNDDNFGVIVDDVIQEIPEPAYSHLLLAAMVCNLIFRGRQSNSEINHRCPNGRKRTIYHELSQ